MNDVIVYSRTAEEHLSLLDETLGRLAAAGLKINPKKTTLVAKEVNYLGHVVSPAGVKPEPKKITAVQSIQEPQSSTHVRAFLGLAGYYRRFIDAFAAITAPLTELTKKNVTFQWEQRHQAAFDELERRLVEAPILQYPRRDRTFIVDCDASDQAAGAVLMQIDEQDNEVVIQYASYTFTEVERRWLIMEREAYAVVWAVRTFRSYLLGTQFIIRTDNSVVAALPRAAQPKLQRWALLLAECSYTPMHRPGKLHSHVDALSRLPTTGTRGEGVDTDDWPAFAATAGVLGGAPTHPSLPLVNWQTAAGEDQAYQAVRRHLSADISGRQQQPTTDLPRWFANMSPRKQSRFLSTDQGLLFRGFPPHDRPRWVVPHALQKAIVAAHHSGAQGAHLGVSRIMAQLIRKILLAEHD